VLKLGSLAILPSFPSALQLRVSFGLLNILLYSSSSLSFYGDHDVHPSTISTSVFLSSLSYFKILLEKKHAMRRARYEEYEFVHN
jgi:hypothetical protein